MRSFHLSDSHRWMRRKVKLGNTLVFHRQCISCRRDFVMNTDGGPWRAVHVGLLGFHCLDEETSRRWASEACPGRQLPEEINDQRHVSRN